MGGEYLARPDQKHEHKADSKRDVMGSFLRGFRTAFSGISTTFDRRTVHRAYFRLTAALFAFTLLFDIGGIWLLFDLTDWNDATAGGTVATYFILRIVGVLLILLLAPVLSILLLNLAFPFFNDAIFLASLRSIDPELAERLSQSPGPKIRESVFIGLFRLGRFLLFSALALLINLVPIAGPIVSTTVQTWNTSEILAWELLEPYFGRLQLPLSEQRRFIRAHRSTLVGFALPFSFALAIPIVGPLLFGLAQSSTALLVHREFSERESAPRGPQSLT